MSSGSYFLGLSPSFITRKRQRTRAGHLHHLGIGATHAHTIALILIDETATTVIDRTTGQILASHTIDPDRAYWRNNHRESPADGRALSER